MRLIDADEVKDLLLGLDSLPWEEEVDGIVDRMQIAYDLEAVLSKLEVLHELVNMNQKLAVSQAIDIVKRGGRNE